MGYCLFPIRYMYRLQGTLSDVWIDLSFHAPVLVLMSLKHIPLQRWIVLETVAATQANNLDQLSLVRNRANFRRIQILVQMFASKILWRGQLRDSALNPVLSGSARTDLILRWQSNYALLLTRGTVRITKDQYEDTRVYA
jgi:hypothetical protein